MPVDPQIKDQAVAFTTGGPCQMAPQGQVPQRTMGRQHQDPPIMVGLCQPSKASNGQLVEKHITVANLPEMRIQDADALAADQATQQIASQNLTDAPSRCTRPHATPVRV